MAELQVRDSLGGEPAWVEDGAAATGAGETGGEFSVSAICHGVPGGAWFRIDLAGGLALLADEREERWAGEGDTCVWRLGVDPSAAPAKARYEVRLSGPEGPLAKAGREVALGRRGDTGFDPRVNGFRFANAAGLFGPPRPSWDIFAKTLSAGPHALNRRLFDGLYPAVFEGGLCTGMARAAIELFESGATPPAAGRSPLDAETQRLIQVMHGRQLSDRALLGNGFNLAVSSPRFAFSRFRKSILARARGAVAFDVGIPVIWRRDFLRAVVREGHTVVPYAYRMLPGGMVEVDVYDPATPPGDDLGTETLRIDRRRNTYKYRHWSSDGGSGATTILAVSMGAYRRGRTAFMAAVASFLLRR